MRAVAIAVICAARLAAADGHAKVGSVARLDRVAALVDTTPIWQSQLDERSTTADLAIDDAIVAAAGVERGVTVSDAETDAAMVEIKKQNNVDDAGLDAALASQHYTRASYRAELTRQLVVLRALNVLIGDQLRGTPEQAAAAKQRWLDGERPKHHIEKPPALAPIASEVAWTALSGPIRAVEVTGGDPALRAAARALVAPEVGATAIERGRLRDELTGVLGVRGVSEVSARATQRADGVVLTIALTAQPIVHALAAREGTGLPFAVSGVFGAATGLPLDPGLLGTMTEQLRDRYLARGYRAANAAWSASPAGAGRVDVMIDITPGTAVTIAGVTFAGNTHASRAELTKALDGTVAGATPWLDDRIERAKGLVLGYYYDHGYLQATVTIAPPTGDHANAAFAIVEGAQYRIGKLAVTGVSPADAKRYLEMLGVHKGDVFSRSALLAGSARIRDASKAKTINPLTNLDGTKHVVDLTLEILP